MVMLQCAPPMGHVVTFTSRRKSRKKVYTVSKKQNHILYTWHVWN